MKTRFRIVNLLVVLSSIFATTTVFAQTQFYTWTGAANGTNLQTAGNWTTNYPSPATPATTLPNGNDGGANVGDVCQWVGSSSNLVLTYGGSAWPNTGFGTYGVTFYLSPTMNHDVQIVSTVGLSASLGVTGVDNEQ